MTERLPLVQIDGDLEELSAADTLPVDILANGSIDEVKLDASINASLDLADSSLQPADIGSSVQGYDANTAFIDQNILGDFENCLTGNRNLSATAGEYIELFRLSRSSGAHSFILHTTVSDSGFSTAKNYMIAAQYTPVLTDYEILRPIHDSGPYGANDYRIEVSRNTTAITVRAVRVSGSTTGSLSFELWASNDAAAETVTALTGTGTSTATVIYNPITASDISDFDAEVSNNTDVAANTAARHDAVTVTDSSEINFTLTGQDITATIVASSVDESKLDASVNVSLDLADSSVQPSDNVSVLTNDAGYLTAATVEAQVDHGLITGLGDDDHTQYLLASGARDVTGPIEFLDYLDIDKIAIPAAPGADVARLFAADDRGYTVLEYIDTEGDVFRVGEDIFRICRNTTGATITQGQLVCFNGSTGSAPNIALAKANSTTTMPSVGAVRQDVLNNAFGIVQIVGSFNSMDTSAWAEGDLLYVSPTTAGAFTNVQPVHPNFLQSVATVEVSGVGNGRVLMNVAPFLSGQESGTRRNNFTIGDETAGAKTVSFDNGFLQTISANPTAARVITLPDATGTVVLADLAATLTNKTINLANNTLTATSAQIAAAVTDETGSGALVFGTSPTLVTPALGTPSALVLTNATGLPTAGLVDASVTLAKMANLAQDQFIGRTTASTGVPQTATITAAARTVLDDTTVANMVNTLGGATSSGTGGLVRTTSPTLITPALGTPSALVLTNATGLPTAGLNNDAVTYAKIQNISATNRILGRITAGAGDTEELTAANVLTIIGVEAGAEVNNISDANATDLTDAGDTTLHYHANDRARANHTGTQTAATISDFDTEVSNNTDVAANTTARHAAVTVTDSTEIDFTLTGQDITAVLKAASIDESKLDASVNASLDLADSSVQPGDNISGLTNDAGYITATLTEEQVEDYVGGMVTGNTETFISVTYEDSDGTLDFVVPVLDEDDMVSNSAAHLATQQSIKAYVDAAAGGVTDHGALTGLADNDHPQYGLVASPLSQFAATTSLELKNTISDETGSGSLVFATSPTLVTPALGTPASGVLTNCTGLTHEGLEDSAARSVLGRSAATSGVVADITAGTDGHILRRSGTTIGFGTIAAAGITDGVVSLAKMANLAQDQFIGRTTASTGVPQTATITSAARTVLDDTSVGNMVNTLGGGTSTGTGVLVRATNPTFNGITVGGTNTINFSGAVGTINGNQPSNYIQMWSNVNASGAGLVMYGPSAANAYDIDFYTNTAIVVKWDDSAGTLSTVGNMSITGSLSKGSGSFRIDHPLPELNKTHELVHSFIEGPQADLIYRGHVKLENGVAKVNIDKASRMTEGTFELLCRDIDTFVSNKTGWARVRGNVTGNILYIESEDLTSNDTVCWLVIGERQDKHMMETGWTDISGSVIVEPLKEDKNESDIAKLADITR